MLAPGFGHGAVDAAPCSRAGLSISRRRGNSAPRAATIRRVASVLPPSATITSASASRGSPRMSERRQASIPRASFSVRHHDQDFAARNANRRPARRLMHGHAAPPAISGRWRRWRRLVSVGIDPQPAQAVERHQRLTGGAARHRTKRRAGQPAKRAAGGHGQHRDDGANGIGDEILAPEAAGRQDDRARPEQDRQPGSASGPARPAKPSDRRYKTSPMPNSRSRAPARNPAQSPPASITPETREKPVARHRLISLVSVARAAG